jgi:hypothetical protein
MIHSPSKLTARVGYQLGMGVVAGMQSTYGAVATAGAGMMALAAPSPYLPSGAAMGGNSYVTNSHSTTIDLRVDVGGHVVGVDDLAAEVAGPIVTALARENQRVQLARGVRR